MKLGWATVEGGPGNDRVAIAAFGAVYGGGGNDIVVGGFYSETNHKNELFGGEGDDWIHGIEPQNSVDSTPRDYMEGGPGRDRLEGNNGNDTLYGGDGNESSGLIAVGNAIVGFELIMAGLYGGAGNDYLDGGDGNDNLDGGADNDILVGGMDNDAILGQDGLDHL